MDCFACARNDVLFRSCCLKTKSVNPQSARGVNPELLRPEHPVAGVAEAGHDVAVVVQPLVDGGGPDRNVRMLLLKMRDAFGGGEQADETDVAGASGFQQ